MRNKNRYYDRGIAFGIILLVIALVAAIVGGIAISAGRLNVDARASTSRMAALELMQGMESVRRGYEIMTARGIDGHLLELNSVSETYGLYHPSNGAAYPYTIRLSDLAALGGSYPSKGLRRNFIYHKNLYINNVGSNGTPNYATIAWGINKDICQQINHLIHGGDDNAEPKATTVASVFWMFPALMVDLRADSDFDSKDERCVVADSSVYIYYKIVAAR